MLLRRCGLFTMFVFALLLDVHLLLMGIGGGSVGSGRGWEVLDATSDAFELDTDADGRVTASSRARTLGEAEHLPGTLFTN